MTEVPIVATVDESNRLLAITVTIDGKSITFPVATIAVRQVSIRDLTEKGFDVIGPHITINDTSTAPVLWRKDHGSNTPPATSNMR